MMLESTCVTFSDFSVFSFVLGGAATTAVVLTEHRLLRAAGGWEGLSLPIWRHCIAMAGIASKT